MPALSYIVPIRAATPQRELIVYLREEIAPTAAEIIVVDGSDAAVFREHAALCAGGPVRHVAVDPRRCTPMGKVGGVLTGVDEASNDRLVIADDDVRYTADQLHEIARLLDDVDLVRPQNYFDPRPWHARWDTARTLIGRALGGDWPGTMALRRQSLLRAGGYAGDVMFENLELERTIVAAGGTAAVALDLLVRRLPPTTAQFLDQRVRQAYDELARPRRMLVSLAVVPTVALTGPAGAGAVAAVAVLLAEVGRRRGGPQARDVFGRTAALWAPLWVAERSVTAWLALYRHVRHGGIPYRDATLRRAATPLRELRARALRSSASSR